MIGRTILSIAVCLGIASVCVAQENPREADFKTSDGVRIHYYMLGTKGTPVVLIHGYTGSAKGNWIDNGIAAELAKNHQVCAVIAPPIEYPWTWAFCIFK